MASPKTIPSKLCAAGAVVPSSDGSEVNITRLYITAILKAGTTVIDGVSVASAGPVSFPSPIVCDTFTAAGAGEVAYYEQ
jgi:hypothetical protein